MENKIKGILFDFNGVLWWDTVLQEQAWKRFSNEVRGTSFSEEEKATHVHGRNNKHTLEYLTGKILSPEELIDLTEQKESAYRKLCLEQGENFKLSPGAIALLEHLTVQKVPFTIATASEKNNVLFFFKHLHLDKWFSMEKVVYDDGTLPGKPAPDIYLRAAEKINVSPEECMVIEDAKSGIKSACAARVGLVVGLGPKAKHSTLLEYGAHMAIEELGELLATKII
ncbi:MAG: HAD family phosphatase [bacterium]|nr:HAD family phosphatase [bacterium]